MLQQEGILNVLKKSSENELKFSDVMLLSLKIDEACCTTQLRKRKCWLFNRSALGQKFKTGQLVTIKHFVEKFRRKSLSHKLQLIYCPSVHSLNLVMFLAVRYFYPCLLSNLFSLLKFLKEFRKMQIPVIVHFVNTWIFPNSIQNCLLESFLMGKGFYVALLLNFM